MEEPVTRLVTSQARDSPAHAGHNSREDFAKPVSLVQIPVLLDHLSDVAWNLYQHVCHISRIISDVLLICNGSLCYLSLLL